MLPVEKFGHCSRCGTKMKRTRVVTDATCTRRNLACLACGVTCATIETLDTAPVALPIPVADFTVLENLMASFDEPEEPCDEHGFPLTCGGN